MTKNDAICILWLGSLNYKSEEYRYAGNVSKNAHREGSKTLLSKWGGVIKMKSVFENGKLRHVAYCEKTGNTARKPKDLM